MNTNIEQESPPARMQEAYRLPRSKYMLFCTSWGYPPPHSDLGPDLDGGYPHPDLGWGIPSLS